MLSLIVAKAKNNVIGKDNKLLWHLSNDLKRFKNLTTNHTMIMGRKTFESLGRVLPNRKHVILSHNPDFKVKDEEALKIAHKALKDVGIKEDYYHTRTLLRLSVFCVYLRADCYRTR